MIKFRIWNKKTEKMIYPDDLGYGICIDNNGWCLLSPHDGILIPQNNEWDHLMQWTGLNDINNNPIYVGDIIEYKVEKFDEKTISYIPEKHLDVVIFANGEFKASRSYFGYEGEGLIDLHASEIFGDKFSMPIIAQQMEYNLDNNQDV